jgi:glyoxylase-like metal-dependent hydrolase (beta-lactamase superfamily II)
MKWLVSIAILVCMASVSLPLYGQGRGAAGPCGGAPRGGDPVNAPRMLKPNVFLITGGGANSIVRVTTEGLILIDTKNPSEELYNALVQQIKTISNLPVKIVINTQHHPDHVGNNQKFIDGGAQVVALEALKTFMTSDTRTSTCTGRPTQTFAKDNVVKLGNAEVHLHFYGRGHTGDDTMVYFPDAKVVMVSDDMTDMSPVIDWTNGGSWVEWQKTLESVLKLDFDTAIQGRGEPKTRADVQAFKDKVDLVIKRANDAIKAGATKETLAMQVKVDDLAPWNLNAQFFGNLYDELKK